MRSLIVATALILSAPLGLGATAAQADTTKVIIRNDAHPRPMHRVVERRHDRDCMMKKVVTRVHGERIVKTTRVCR